LPLRDDPGVVNVGSASESSETSSEHHCIVAEQEESDDDDDVVERSMDKGTDQSSVDQNAGCKD